MTSASNLSVPFDCREAMELMVALKKVANNIVARNSSVSSNYEAMVSLIADARRMLFVRSLERAVCPLPQLHSAWILR